MRYISTRTKDISYSFSEAVRLALAEDGGLIVPERFPEIDQSAWWGKTYPEIACEILRVNGYKTYEIDPTIEALLQIKQGQPEASSIQLGDLLVGGILIAALGAVNDVAMSISSGMIY